MSDYRTEELRMLLENGAVDETLREIAKVVHSLVYDARVWGQGLYAPELDLLLHQAGLAVFTQKKLSPPSSGPIQRNVFIVSEMYADGGHTRLVEEMVEILGDYTNHVVVTDLFDSFATGRNKLTVPIDNLTKRGAKVSILPPVPLLEKVGMLMELLCAEAPDNVFLMAHYQDVVAIASTCPALGLRAYFLHHTEHSLALGSSLRDYVHIDFRPASRRHCTHFLGRPTVLLHLSSGDQKLKEFGDVTLESCSTVSGGNWQKFICAASPVSYVEALVRILRHIGGSHFHFSPVPDDALKSIRSALEQNGIDPDRFKYLGWVPSVGETLHSIDAHIYLPSFPWGGGLSNVEAMGNGYPIIRPKLPGIPPLLEIDMDYPEAESWSNVDELVGAIDKTVQSHERHSLLARGHYEAFHTREQFNRRLRAIVS